MTFLLIDTATEKGWCACYSSTQLLFSIMLPFGNDQSKYLLPLMEKELEKNSNQIKELEFIGIGIGPGSYTGVRVGASVAKALAYGWNIPLVAFSTLSAFVYQEEGIPFYSVIDAKLGGIYLQKGIVENHKLNILEEPRVMPLEMLTTWTETKPILVTPYKTSLLAKTKSLAPNFEGDWIEADPNSSLIADLALHSFLKGNIAHPKNLPLNYLREWSGTPPN